MWWMSGIFRSVDLLLRPAGGIHDLATVTDFDPATGTGTVEVTVHGADGAPIEATLEVPALDLREDVGPGTVTLEAGEVRPWSVEDSHLCDAVVTTGAEKVTQRMGVHRVMV